MKVSVTYEEYDVFQKDGVVVCKIYGCVTFENRFLEKVYDTFNDFCITSEGVANLKDGDKFDEQKGKRIARAKAKRNMRKKVIGNIQNIVRNFSKSLSETVEGIHYLSELNEKDSEFIRK